MGKFGKQYHKKKSKEHYTKSKKLSNDYQLDQEKITFTDFKKKTKKDNL